MRIRSCDSAARDVFCWRPAVARLLLARLPVVNSPWFYADFRTGVRPLSQDV